MNFLTDVVTPINGDQGAGFVHWVAVVLLFFQVQHIAMLIHNRTPAGFLVFIHDGHGEYVGTTRAQGAGYFFESELGVENMFHHVLGDVQVYAFVGEGEFFDVLRAVAPLEAAARCVWEILARNVVFRFLGNSGASTPGGG